MSLPSTAADSKQSHDHSATPRHRDRAKVRRSPSSRHLKLAERPPRRARARRAHFGVIEYAENLVHGVVAIVLMAVATIVLYDTTHTLATKHGAFPTTATTAVSGVLFAVIIVEIMRTVLAHFDGRGLQLQPFLIIGIISAVREILTVSARLSLYNPDTSAGVIHSALLELSINAAVVVGLTASLVLVRRLAGIGLGARSSS